MGSEIDRLNPVELPELTPKQMAFVRGIAEGKTASDAYRASYDSDGDDPSIWVQASNLKRHYKVNLWLEELKRSGYIAALCTRESHLTELHEIRETAKSKEQLGVALNAEVQRGKVSGLYETRVNVHLSADDAFAQLLDEMNGHASDRAKVIEHD